MPKRRAPEPVNPQPPQHANPQPAMPELSGPWLKKCIQRWHLIAPFDETIDDVSWRRYYKERAALDWYTKVANGLSSIEDGEEWTEELEKSKWNENWTKPKMEPYKNGGYFLLHDCVQEHVKSMGTAIKETIDGCSRLTADVPDIGNKFASGVYMLGGYSENSGMDGECTELIIATRLYSPYGLGTSVDFKLAWHERARLCSFEHFARVNKFCVRSAEECNPSRPLRTVWGSKDDYGNEDYPGPDHLFSMYQKDSGYMKKTLGEMDVFREAEVARPLGPPRCIVGEKTFHAVDGRCNSCGNK